MLLNATIMLFIRLQNEAMLLNATITQFIRLQNLPSCLLKPLQATCPPREISLATLVCDQKEGISAHEMS